MKKREPERLRVRLKSPSTYEIVIGSGVLNQLGPEARKTASPLAGRACLISNPTVFAPYGKIALRSLRLAGFKVSHWLMPDGERHKTWRTLDRALQFLVGAGLERSDLVVALGGGVVGDLAGLAAALYLRGISFMQVPTTLLAQIDASVGGKTAVNTASGKNLGGAFHQPCAVVIDVETLGTLPGRELTAGWCEAIKQGAVASRKLFGMTRRFLERDHNGSAEEHEQDLINLISAHCAFKARVVARDEREDLSRQGRNSRRVLNFGHTVGHALEAITRFRRFRDGEAVGLGMIAAAEPSARLGMLEKSELQLLRDTIRLAGRLPHADDLNHAGILQVISRDKKSAGGSVQWVLLEKVGRARLFDGREISSVVLGDSLNAALQHDLKD